MPDINQNRKSFIFGLFKAVLLVGGISFLVMVGFYLNKLNKSSASRSAEPTPVSEGERAPGATGMRLLPVSNSDWVRGGRNAKISIIEFSDTECPFCKQYHSILKRVVQIYGGRVNWVYRHFPLASIHSKAPKEAEAAECAGELGGNGGFWKYIDRLFEITPSNNQLDAAQLPVIAQEAGLDVNKFKDCLRSGRYAVKVQNNFQQAVAAGARGTPYSVIVAGDKKIPLSGVVPLEQLKLILDSLLGQSKQNF